MNFQGKENQNTNELGLKVCDGKGQHEAYRAVSDDLNILLSESFTETVPQFDEME